MGNKNHNTFQDLSCVYCDHEMEGAIQSNSRFFTCNKCGQKYPIIQNIPILINKNKSIFANKDYEESRNLFFDLNESALKILIRSIVPNNSSNWKSKSNLEKFGKVVKNQSNPKVLIVGGSVEGKGLKKLLNTTEISFVESDVSFGPRTQIIFDCHNIPYKDNTFDGVIVQAVLEHVVNPFRCVNEIHRVLKPDGIVYAETPFMQQVHGGPFDFTRFTHSGHRYLFQQFDEISSGVTAGPGTAMLWSYEYLLISIFGFWESMVPIIKVFARVTGFWLKYLDLVSLHSRRSQDGASGLFFWGRKSSDYFNSSDLVGYYSHLK